MRIKLITPSRLHFGLIDLNGTIGRIDGGLGVALKEPNIIIDVEKNHNTGFKLNLIKSPGYSISEIEQLVDNIIKSLNVENQISLTITSHIPAHNGLGSKTQLSLGISKAICLLNKIDKTPYELARLTSRSGTSRIGLSAFENGGFIVDGGHSFGNDAEKQTFLPSSASNAPPAPVIYWDEVPEDWYFIIIIPKIKHGAHGSEELDIFQKSCPIPLDEVKTISHIILMKILPSMKEKQIESFGRGIYELQHIGFKKLEIKLQDEIVSRLIEFCMEQGASGAGMSSFGPTTFAIIKGAAQAQKLKQKIVTFMKNDFEADIFITTVNNQGALVNTV